MSGPPSDVGSNPAKQPRSMRTRNAVIAAIVSFAVGVGIGAAGGSSTSGTATVSQTPSTPGIAASPASEPTAAVTLEPTLEVTPELTPEPTPPPAEPVVVKGSGSQKTKPFEMPGGDFTVTITGNGDGNVIASLIPRGAETFEGEGLFNEISNGKYKYETAIYGVEPGSYYLDVSNDNAWVVTFTPLQ